MKLFLKKTINTDYTIVIMTFFFFENHHHFKFIYEYEIRCRQSLLDL